MRKTIVLLGLLGLIAQPVSAQSMNTAVTGSATNVYPIAQPSASNCGTGIVGPTIEPVKVQKRHWWQRTRTGYRAVSTTSPSYIPVQAPSSTTTGGAVQIQTPCGPCNTGLAVPVQTPCNTGCAVPVQSSCNTGCAAPINSSLEPVLIPKAHFWEGDRVELMQINGPKTTGAAAPIYLIPQGVPSGGATTINISPEIHNTPAPPKIMHEKMKTGGASSVRGYW